MKKGLLSELNDLHASQELKQKTLQSVMHKNTKHTSKKVSFAVIISACICFFFLYQGNIAKPSDYPIETPITSNQLAYSYVSIDINPSMELVLDKVNNVIDIKTFNDDATILLEGYAFDGKDAQTVLKEIVSLPKFQPYLAEGYLQVSVFSEDENASTTIEETLDSTLAQVLEQDQYGCTCASKQEKEGADEHHMSFGKYQIIYDITEKDESYTVANLQDYSMRELKDIYESLFQKQYQGNSHNMNSEKGNKRHHGQNHK